MSKQHYIKIAAVLAGNYATCATDDERRKVVGIAFALADVCAQDNDRFDRVRFLSACHLNRGEGNGELT